ncbi:MAG: HNH endonuclease [Mesorhizobium sp.]|nr:HNH endonuclease [Mesorhizobium sp.]MBN9270615.1 HNH endonuclease [Mesorhizobium sp.]
MPAVRMLDHRTVRPRLKRADDELQTSAHRRWREFVLERAGHRCQALDDAGNRCPKASPDHRLFADHIIERRDGGDPLDLANGQCLCGSHHSLKTARTRAERMSGRPEGMGV